MHDHHAATIAAGTPRRFTRLLATLASVGLLGACAHRPELPLPHLPQPAGQLAADARPDDTRGVILARIAVVTNGEPGFGPISNPLVLQFRDAESDADTLSPLDPDAHLWTSDASRPSQWRYQPPGLLAVSVAASRYAGLLIAYPDDSHFTAAPSSIPQPSAPLAFAPIEVPPGDIVYVGDIQIRQTASFWDVLLDRVEVTYAVTDEYDRAVADFRARYPQFAEVEVKRRVARADVVAAAAVSGAEAEAVLLAADG